MQTADHEPIRVIITDDHALYRAGVKTSLSFRKRIKVIGEAENGLRLLELLKTVQPDVILLDIQMPVMDGMATLPEVKRLFPDIKVIILSFMDDQSMITKVMELGANAYLPKTSDPEVIFEAIQTCFEQGYYHNTYTARSLHNVPQQDH